MNKIKEKVLKEEEVLNELYEKGYIDFSGTEKNPALHSSLTGRSLINIYKEGYKKALAEVRKEIQHILEECRIDMGSITYTELKVLRNKIGAEDD